MLTVLTTLVAALILLVPTVLSEAAGLWARLAELPVATPQTEQTKLLFVGDMFYDRSIRAYANQYGDEYIFSCLNDHLQAYDLVVANFESPITGQASVSVGSAIGSADNYRFTSPLRTAGLLAAHNIRAVTIGNNHIYNFSAAGIDETRAALADASVTFVGDPRDATSTSALLPTEVPIALVAFNEFLPVGGSFADTIAHIRERDQEAFVVVFAHWGDEYVGAAERQRQWAHAFVEAGADLVVGSHPHVVQEHEEYQGVPIYYSLGNFMFDQYWEASVSTGLALEVVVSEDGIEGIAERTVHLGRDRRTCFVESLN